MMSPLLEILSDGFLGVLTGAALVLIALAVHILDKILHDAGIDYE